MVDVSMCSSWGSCETGFFEGGGGVRSGVALREFVVHILSNTGWVFVCVTYGGGLVYIMNE